MDNFDIWNDAELVQEGSEWEMYKLDNIYGFRKIEDDEWALTPKGNQLTTNFEKIAHRLLDDLDSFGEYYRGGDSALPWQYTIIDNFSCLSHKEIEEILDSSFLKKKDWTLDSNLESNPRARVLFGIQPGKREMIRKWLSKCSYLQLTAACCIGNACYSLNVAYTIAELMETTSGNDYNEKLHLLANNVAACIDEVPFVIMSMFRLFELYYGVHMEKCGTIII